MPTIIGVAGGSCSGKTTLAHRAVELLTPNMASLVAQDHYYYDQSHKFDKDGGSVNFDHPSAIDFDLLSEHLNCLKRGESIEVPIYDFATHQRRAETTRLNPNEVIIVDGTLILSQESVRSQLDQSIFIECAYDLRFQRRLNRDVSERGRTPDGVRAQFQTQVEPMHQMFVEPSKDFADIVVFQYSLIDDLDACVRQLMGSPIDK